MPLSVGVGKVFPFFLIICTFAPHALAASPVCVTGWEWASNSKQQNPCEVAGALEATCRGVATYELGPVPLDTGYLRPFQNDTVLKCECNTVMFSLYMACTSCQNATSIVVLTMPWSSWSNYCPTVNISKYPGIIPPDTAIPHWAFLDYTTGDRFNSLFAMAAGDMPEALASSSTTPSSTSTLSSTSPLSTSIIPTSSSTGGTQNMITIIGGAIGGLVFLVVVGVGTWLFLRKRGGSGGEAGGNHLDDTRHPVDAVVSEPSAKPSWMRLYNPSDPSTFPDQSHGLGEACVAPFNSGQFTGAPKP